MTNEVRIRVTAQDDASAAFKRAGDAAEGLGGRLKRVGEIAGGFLAASVISQGIGAFTGFLKDSIGAAQEAARVDAQLEAVLKSTGHAAGLTANELKGMAKELQNLTNFDDEAVLGAENLLLTFTGIGRDVFPAATKAVLDMSQALGQDLKSSSIQLGKALNDPIEGLTALKRVGVSFTESQKEQIKTLQESGDIMGAQTLILAELNKEFGGSAEAAVKADGGITQMKNKIGDMQEEIGKKLLPVMVEWQQLQLAIVTSAINDWIPAMEGLAQSLGGVIKPLAWMVEHAGGLGAIFKTAFAVGGLGLAGPLIMGGGQSRGDQEGITNEPAPSWIDNVLKSTSEYILSMGRVGKAADQAAAANDGAAASATKGRDAVKEWASALDSALADSTLSYQEFLDLNERAATDKLPQLTQAMAGQLEAAKVLSTELDHQAERSFNLGKAITSLGIAASTSGDAFARVASKLTQTALDLVRAASSAIFGKPTREEATLEAQIAAVDEQIAGFVASATRGGQNIDATLAPLQRLRDGLQSQLALLQAHNRTQEAQLVLADQTLISEQTQDQMAKTLTEDTRKLSGTFANLQAQLGNSLVPAFDAARRAVGDFASAMGQSGLARSVSSFKATGGIIPGYAGGSSFVPQTGLAMLHRGEQVIPAGGSGGGDVHVHLEGSTIYGVQDLQRIIVSTVRDAALGGGFRGVPIGVGAG